METLFRYTIIILLGAALFVPFLGHVHLFDWDEINFAECAREMILTKDYLRAQINFQPFWEKPPLFIWMQAASMKLFGIGEFAARFPNALAGIVTLCVLYHTGRKWINGRMAMWWVVLYAATWLPHFYFKSGIIDPVFNLFIFLAFYFLHRARYDAGKTWLAFAAGISLGLAVMTKGPVAILVAVLSFGVYIILNKGLWGYTWKHLSAICAGVLIICSAWFAALLLGYGWDYVRWFFTEFITYQIRLFRTEDADHGGPFFYHFIILLIGCFPASAFLFQYRKRRYTDNEAARNFTKWMWIVFWVVLILFSVVKTKIVHYSSLCYFPLTYLAALQVYRLSEGYYKIKRSVKIILVITGSLFALLIALLPLAGMYKSALIPFINDPFAVANLAADVPWSYAECLWGIVYLLGVWICVLMMGKNFRKAMSALCILQVLLIQITVVHFTPKVEAYSQRAAVDFFKSKAGRDVYVHVLGYKSFAQMFYTEMQKPSDAHYYDAEGRTNEQWLLSGNIDRPAYFVCKITSAEQYRAMPELKELYRKNGFVFFMRSPAASLR